jgi:general secretion pathway protein D
VQVGSGDQLQNAKVDVVDTQTFSGTIVAQDNVAVAVGGLIQDSANDQQTKTPVLGDIPVLGMLFKQDASDRSRRELIIIIKPHIQETPSESAEVSQEFVRQESVHPNSRAMGGTMDIYRNPGRHHDDYRFQQRYKFYDNQDDFDDYHRRTRNPEEEPSMPPDKPPMPKAAHADGGNPEGSQQEYLGLTRFAAHAVRQAHISKDMPLDIQEAALIYSGHEPILPDSRLQVEPLESWKRGKFYVTTVQLKNRSGNAVRIDVNQLRGQWLASTIEKPKLSQQGVVGDSTYMYLVSGEPFHEALRR